MAIIPLRFMRELENEPRLMRPLGNFQKEINRVMDSFFTDWDIVPSPSAQANTALAVMPSVDVIESPKDFKVHVELPGIDEKDVEISYNKGILTIKGEKKYEHEEKDKNYIRSERSYGSFMRQIPFNLEVDDNKIEAEFKKGVLNITLPKAQAALKEAKKIPIKT